MIQEFTQEMKNLVLDILRGVHTVITGKIVTFDPDKCEASILPFGKFKKPDGSMMDYPQLNEVPVYVMQGSEQTATFVYPIKKDDECILLFSEQALDVWRTKAESDTDLKFDLSNAIAIIGQFSKPNPLIKEACKDNSVIIEKDGERVRLKKGETYISDTADQSITMTPDAITTVANNVIVKNKGNTTVTIEGNADVTVGGNAKMDISGTADVKAGGAVTIKGSTVAIN